MALILSMRNGDDFYLGDRRVVVSEITGPRQFTVTTEDGVAHGIVADRMAEIFPDVFVGCGKSGTYIQVRVAIDAPREVTILRGTKYRESSQ